MLDIIKSSELSFNPLKIGKKSVIVNTEDFMLLDSTTTSNYVSKVIERGILNSKALLQSSKGIVTDYVITENRKSFKVLVHCVEKKKEYVITIRDVTKKQMIYQDLPLVVSDYNKFEINPILLAQCNRFQNYLKSEYRHTDIKFPYIKHYHIHKMNKVGIDSSLVANLIVSLQDNLVALAKLITSDMKDTRFVISGHGIKILAKLNKSYTISFEMLGVSNNPETWEKWKHIYTFEM